MFFSTDDVIAFLSRETDKAMNANANVSQLLVITRVVRVQYARRLQGPGRNCVTAELA